MMLDQRLLDRLVCPKCRGGLEYRVTELTLDCTQCRLSYPVRDDIPVMLVDQATAY